MGSRPTYRSPKASPWRWTARCTWSASRTCSTCSASEWTGSAGRRGAFVLQHRLRRVVLHRFAAVLGAAQARIHLALADDLTVACLEYEVVFAVARFLDLEGPFACRVLAYRIDAVQRGSMSFVLFAGQHDLPVAGQQVEMELAVAGFLHLELARHGDTSCDGLRRFRRSVIQA